MVLQCLGLGLMVKLGGYPFEKMMMDMSSRTERNWNFMSSKADDNYNFIDILL